MVFSQKGKFVEGSGQICKKFSAYWEYANDMTHRNTYYVYMLFNPGVTLVWAPPSFYRKKRQNRLFLDIEYRDPPDFFQISGAKTIFAPPPSKKCFFSRFRDVYQFKKIRMGGRNFYAPLRVIINLLNPQNSLYITFSGLQCLLLIRQTFKP